MIVEIGGHIGVVEEITLRSVRLRDYDGNVIFVPCGNITNVVNMTMEYSRSVIDVVIAYRGVGHYAQRCLADGSGSGLYRPHH